jgi:hypothetical protein
MNFKTTYLLFGLLLGMLGLFLVTQMRGKKATDTTAYVLPSLQAAKVDSKDVNGLEIDITGKQPQKLEFVRNNRGWRLRQPDVRADAITLNGIVSQLMNATQFEQADMSANPSVYGLNAPAAIVTLSRGDQRWSINIGQASGKENSLIYVTSSDQPNEAMAVQRSRLDNLIKDVDAKGEVKFKALNDYRAKTLLADSAFDINAIKLQEGNKATIAIDKTPDGKWKFEKPPFGEADYEGEPASAAAPGAPQPQRITGVRELLQSVADIKVESDDDFGATGVDEAALAGKGLEKGKALLRIEAKVQPPFGSDDKEPIDTALLIGKKADDKGEKYFARLEDERNIVKVPGKKVEAVLKVYQNPSVVRNHDLAQFDTSHVDAIDIKAEGHDAFKLRKAGEPATWKLFEGGKARDAEDGTIQALLTALTEKRLVKDFPEPNRADAELGLDKPGTVLSLWVDGIKKDEKKEEEKKDDAAKDEKKDAKAETKKDEKKEEKKDPNAEPKLKEDKPTVRFYFGRKDKDLVYVKREAGGETQRVAVPAGLFDKASAGQLAYLSRKLPASGSVADVSKVLLTRGSQMYELEKVSPDKGPTTWKFKQPKELAGRNADPGKIDRLVGDLHSLQAERYVAEKPTANDVERYGLANPAYKVVLTVTKADKKTEDHVYEIGKETDDKTGIYARQGGRDLVFVVRKNVADDLQGELRDPLVFTFDPLKVKTVKLVGWQDVAVNPVTLDLERKGNQNWVVKAPAGFNLDTGKIESFVSSISTLRAERFVGPKTPPKPEYKLDLPSDALEVAITVEGEKEPFTLTIGGPNGAEGYFATSNRLPNDVFQLPKGNFDLVKGKPTYFRKD